MKRIASQTQMVADFFLGFSSFGGVAEGRGGFLFGAQSCTELGTEFHNVIFGTRMKRIASQTQIYADFFFRFLLLWRSGQRSRWLFFVTQSCTELGTELLNVNIFVSLREIE